MIIMNYCCFAHAFDSDIICTFFLTVREIAKKCDRDARRKKLFRIEDDSEDDAPQERTLSSAGISSKES